MQWFSKHFPIIEAEFSVRSARRLYTYSGHIFVWRRGRIPPPWPCES
jgi:hypothetical protein